MSQLRFYPILLIAVLIPISTRAQIQQPDAPARIEIEVEGKAIDETKAAETKKKDDWIELSSKNFLAAGDADLEDLRQAVSEAELFRSRFAGLFPRANGPSSVPTRIVVFRDRKSIRQFGPLNERETVSDKPYFRPGRDVNYLVLAAGDFYSHDMIREFVRQLARDSISPVPLWFQEGMAEYFSTYELSRLGSDRVLRLGLDDYKQDLHEKKLIPLSALFSVSREDFESMDSETKKFFSAESCALFDYLLVSRRLTSTLRMINDMAEGKPAAQSFRDAFKLNLLTFEENFRRQIQFSKLMGWSSGFAGFSMEPGKSVIRVLYGRGVWAIPTVFDSVRDAVESLPVQLLTEAQTEAYRGDILLHNNRLDEAELRLRKAIELDGKLAIAFLSLGAVKAAQNDYEQARDYIEKTLLVDPSNYLAHFQTAAFIRKKAMDSNLDLTKPQLWEMHVALTRAIQLAPEYVDTSELLALTIRLLHEDPAVSSRLLVDGLRRSPGRESLLMEMARAAAENGEKATAGWTLQRLIFSGNTDGRMKQDARDLLERLNLTAAQKAAFRNFSGDSNPREVDPGFTVRIASKKDRLSLAKSEDKGTFVRGLLMNVDCSKGLTLYIWTGTPPLRPANPNGPNRDPNASPPDQRMENLHTDSPNRIDWVSDDGQPVHAVACGKAAYPYTPVVITYKPGRKGLMMGEPFVVEFLRLPINIETIR